MLPLLAVLLAATQAAAPAPAPAGPVVVLETTQGRIRIALDKEKAPVSVENFLGYVRSGFYDGTIFHRVIPGFMAQGGGYDAMMKQKPTKAPIKNESANGLSNKRGTLAMARTSDPDSATAQFFINLKDNGFLNHTGKNPQGWGYAVFGRVIEGMDVVDAIARVKTGRRGPHDDVPAEAVVIQKATVRPAEA
jgi:peptidyl-prolyl cis-trans isomerase B (cyclophilin B)